MFIKKKKKWDHIKVPGSLWAHYHQTHRHFNCKLSLQRLSNIWRVKNRKRNIEGPRQTEQALIFGHKDDKDGDEDISRVALCVWVWLCEIIWHLLFDEQLKNGGAGGGHLIPILLHDRVIEKEL